MSNLLPSIDTALTAAKAVDAELPTLTPQSPGIASELTELKPKVGELETTTASIKSRISSLETQIANYPGSVSINDVSLTEGDSGTKLATFTVTRTGGTGAFSVNFSTANGTATAGSDYVAATGTLSFAAGVNTQPIAVTIGGDSTVEPNETFFVDLSGITNGGQIAKGQGICTITNDDQAVAAPVFRARGTVDDRGSATVNALQSTIAVSQGDLVVALIQRDQQAQIQSVTLNGTAMSLARRVDSGAAGYGLDVWAVIAPANAASAVVRATYANSAQWGTLSTYSWSGIGSATPLAGSSRVLVASTSTARSSAALSSASNGLALALGTEWNAGRNHTPASGWVKRADGTSSSIHFVLERQGIAPLAYTGSSFSTTSVADGYLVALLFFPLIGSPPPASSVVTVACAPASVAEDGTANLVYTFTRSGSTASSLTVSYTLAGTATTGSDFPAMPATVTFAPGAATATVTVNPTTDSTVESDETVILTLAPGSGYTLGTPSTATGTITNDDAGTPPPSGTLRGWELNTTNVGLAPFSLVGSQLPVYTGTRDIPAGSRISGVRFTGHVNCYAGDITIERCVFRPTNANTSWGLPLVSTTNYNGNGESGLGRVIIRDCEFDGSLLTAEWAASMFAFNGIADLQRNYIHGFGSGIGLANTGEQFDSLVEHNFATDMIAFGNAATTGNHIDAFTVRDFPDNVRPSRVAIIRNNRFDAGGTANVTGAFFIQAIYGRIDNVTIEGNLLEGKGYNLGLEAGQNGYSNITCVNNRFSPTGFGTHYVAGGSGWGAWQDNYLYNPGAADARGTLVSP